MHWSKRTSFSLDFATAFVVLLCGWSIAHLYEATYWYNRNLAIIANIEKQFLLKQDLHDIHYYFGEHRKVNKMLDQFKLQYALAVGIAVMFVSLHFEKRVLPGMKLACSEFEFQRVLPYLFIAAVVPFIWYFKRRYAKKYWEFLQNSPGISVDVSGVEYGIGHPIQDLSNFRVDVAKQPADPKREK